MRITHFFRIGSKNAMYMRSDYDHAHGTIYTRYVRPSEAKIRAWENIKSAYILDNGVHQIYFNGALHTLQYNYDLRVAGTSSNFFSTIASFEDIDTGKTYLIKETHANTYMCELEV